MNRGGRGTAFGRREVREARDVDLYEINGAFAVARSHDLLVRSDWRGVALKDLVTRTWSRSILSRSVSSLMARRST